MFGLQQQQNDRIAKKPRRWFVNHPVPLALGILLLIAAGLKIYERLVDPSASDVSAGRGWLLILLAECEIALGVWLLSGRAKVMARWVAIATFGLFAVYNVWLMIIGQEYCDCLGMLKVRPVYMLVFDVTAASCLLLAWHPKHELSGRLASMPLSRRFATVGIIALLVGGATLAAAIAVRQTTVQGQLVVIGDWIHDFGEVTANKKLTHTFQLRNDHREAIEIVDVKSNCGCTTTDDVTGSLIPPGSVKEIPVFLRTGILDQVTEFGDITVFYRPQSGGETAFEVLRVEATVRTDFEISPGHIDFGPVPVGKSLSQTITLSPRKMTDARVTAVETSGGSFQAELIQGDGRTIRVTYSPQPAPRSGPEGTRLTIHTNSPNVPKFYLSALAHRVVPVEITPMAVVIGPESRGVVSREVLITATTDFDIENVHCDDPRVTALQKSSERGGSQTLVVTIQEAVEAPVDADLRVTLKHNGDTTTQEAYRVSIPVHRFQPRNEGK